MSTCISRKGEYSDHEPGDWCPRCGAFNEEAIVAERDALRAQLDTARKEALEEAAQAALSTPLTLNDIGYEAEEIADAIRALAEGVSDGQQ